MEKRINETDVRERDDGTTWIVLSILGVAVILGILLAHTYQGDNDYEMRGRYMDELRSPAGGYDMQRPPEKFVPEKARP